MFETKVDDASKVVQSVEGAVSNALPTIESVPSTISSVGSTQNDPPKPVAEITQPTPVIEPVSELRRSTRVSIPRQQTNQKYREPISNAKTLLSLNDSDESNVDTDPTLLISVTEATLESITPRNAYQAVRSTLQDKWLAAMNREKDCHRKNGTFDYVTAPPSDVKSIPTDWVFKVKHRGGVIEISSLDEKQFKARVVTRTIHARRFELQRHLRACS